jgi:hypothetical protein
MDVVSIEPILELPFKLQIAQKFAFKQAYERIDALPGVTSKSLLYILRLNYHLLSMLDVGAEYRLLEQFLANDFKHGFLVEVNYILAKYVRLGVGYNFTSFSDNEYTRNDKDEGGFFFRVVGKF